MCGDFEAIKFDCPDFSDNQNLRMPNYDMVGEIIKARDNLILEYIKTFLGKDPEESDLKKFCIGYYQNNFDVLYLSYEGRQIGTFIFSLNNCEGTINMEIKFPK